ncbi:MAG TPA: hypothetical protein VGI35_02820 [Steroidobacteraceae bacterium]
MSRNLSPPRLAVWILSRSLRDRRSEALIGDLTEEYRHGRSRAWYWRQALWAIAVDLRERPRWRFCWYLARRQPGRRHKESPRGQLR